MKVQIAVPLLAVAHAFVLPDPKVFEQLAINDDHHEGSSWRDLLPAKDDVAASVGETLASISSGIDYAIETVKQTFSNEFEQFWDLDGEDPEESFADSELLDRPHRGHGHHGRHHHHHTSNLTIYQLISKSNYTTKFAKLVDEYDDIVELLNSTKANHTLFVPVNKAFEHIPKDKKPGKEFIEAVLKYHIGLGFYPAGRLLATHTVPTALDEPLLGDKPQRLRTRVGLFGVRVNFFAKVIAANIPAKNGIIHAVDHILVPPPVVGRELTLFPQAFSTLLLAFEKTDFVKYIHSVPMLGSTVFAPTNRAFAALGPRANAFLFNTETGLHYLKALLKYHIVANSTLYSDALYEVDKDSGEFAPDAAARYHIDLPTLLGETTIAVDISRLGGWITLTANGYARVSVQDAIAKNGVMQVVNRILVPPRKPKGHGVAQLDDGEDMDVDDLKERLEEYVEEKEAQDWMSDL